ncbi:ABC transporter substrate-binding protein [Comamonas serinivorans]|uniref:ABC transporter substrate-binding protein n=1 Tax=Comamonas serinivorans TaxID=1082851 RepID=A0A1Y0EN85_9BURK|nr:tripartite tricarboxylate transporter substrate binding protein [Comamonas serinivorans]ARU04772.1 ABC transporter substrate-binding protein [Comamonas serinivorans]
MSHAVSRRALALALPALLVTGHASAQDAAANYPNRPVRVIVGMPPGGATDIMARVIGEKLGAQLGQSFVVDNRPGAGGIIGTDAVAKAAPDGYTISLILSGAVIANQFVYSKLPYNPDKDFTYVSQVMEGVVVLTADAKAPYKDAKEFAAYAKANPGKVSYGSYSTGSYGHVVMAYMNKQQGADMTHVAYKGEAPMIQGMLGGEAQLAFGSVMNMGPHVASGKFKYLGVSGPKRMAALPNVPTLAEQGLTDAPYRMSGWAGFIAPAATPKPIIDKLAAAIHTAMADPAIQKRIRDMGFEPTLDSSPAKNMERYKHDVPIWKNLIELADAKIQ